MTTGSATSLGAPNRRPQFSIGSLLQVLLLVKLTLEAEKVLQVPFGILEIGDVR